MNTFTRNSTVRLIGKDDSYEAEERRREAHIQIHGYRRDRARKRQIFLKTYKLGSSIRSGDKLTRSRKLKKMVVKVKSAVLSVLSFMRGGALRSCSSRSAIRASTPAPLVKFYS
ncbi:hypothetical protein MIMGU_mgv1a018796mg [Erythranthe guttata]|uniref:Uncharacterized protein n=1 Tax=Erythranthe guttata TaxID=4155 RepID=A0A022QFX1_ERYGU|nr:hypothetical protein MIMGU_mgv1a018796mg [Erythranthe guttata]